MCRLGLKFVDIFRRPNECVIWFGILSLSIVILNDHLSVYILNITGIRRSVTHQLTLSLCHAWLVKNQVLTAPVRWFIIFHDDVIKWKLFPRDWPFVRGIHRSPVNSLHKGQWRRALMFSLFCARINGWVNNREAGDLRRHQAHCDVIVMFVTGND